MTRSFNLNCALAYVVLLVVLNSALTKTRTERPRPPTIFYISQEQIKDIGGTVDLECSVQNARDYPILWIKLDTENRGAHPLLISSGNTLIIRDSRFSINYDASTSISMYSLQIRDMQETDEGVYQCHIVIGVSNRVTANVEVLIRTPPITSDNSTGSLDVSQGQRIALESVLLFATTLILHLGL